jgi:CRISPR-associated protein Cst2
MKSSNDTPKQTKLSTKTKHVAQPIKKFRSITIASEFRAENHIANGGDGITTNMSSVKVDGFGRSYISGGRCRTALAMAIDSLNDDPNTYVSNGDGVSGNIVTDLRSDLFGFMNPAEGGMSGRRNSPITCNPATAQEPSTLYTDLFTRNSKDPDNGKDKVKLDEVTGKNKSSNRQMLGHRQVSNMDMMTVTFALDLRMIGNQEVPKYEKGKHLSTSLVSKIEDNEKLRRMSLFVDGTRNLSFSNQARNAFCAEPERVLIVLDPKLSRKAERFWRSNTTNKWRENFLAELEERNAIYFIGDDSSDDHMSVNQAYSAAFEVLSANPDNFIFPTDSSSTKETKSRSKK